MSYCKENKGSDFYIWRNASGVYCVMSQNAPVKMIESPEEMLGWLMIKYLDGFKVPLYAIRNLIDDVTQDGKS